MQLRLASNLVGDHELLIFLCSSRVLGLQTCSARPVPLSSAMLGTERRPPGSREGIEVKSTDCSAEGCRFICQHPHGSSQLFIIPVPGDRAPSHRHTCMQNTKAHKTKINKLLKRKQRSASWVLSKTLPVPTPPEPQRASKSFHCVALMRRRGSKILTQPGTSQS